MRTAVVMTTIHNPQNLGLLLGQLGPDDHLVIAGDRKTPHIKCDDSRVEVLDIRRQMTYLRNPIGTPFDCIQRRNAGYLFAIKEFVPDVIISVDDDNLPHEGWLQEHVAVLGERVEVHLQCPTNVMDIFLDTSCKHHASCRNVVHRGNTFSQVFAMGEATLGGTEAMADVAVNAGMWTGDPDINAYDRILHPGLHSHSANNKYVAGLRGVVIEAGNWYHPFNSQNTAVRKELFPALFLVPMCAEVNGLVIGRYDDIWQSYICQKVMAHYGMGMRFGTPFVRQERNDHSVLADLKEEHTGMFSTDRLLQFLEETTLYGNCAHDNMYEIADRLLRVEDRLFNHIGNGILWWLSELR
jgi:hypothetical protein